MTLKRALVIIDLQEDFLPPDGALAVPDGRAVVPLIEELVESQLYNWSAIIATQDWHPQDHTSFASQHNLPPFTKLEFSHPLGELDPTTGNAKSQTNMVWPDHCVENTPGSALEASFQSCFELVGSKVPTTIIKKGYLSDREYYSCFQDTWGIDHTGIEKYLQNHGITEIVMVGLAYDFCVLNSAIDSVNAGFKTTVLKDCCRSVYVDKMEETEGRYSKGNVVVTNSKEYECKIRELK